jgi:hypothetical protein
MAKEEKVKMSGKVVLVLHGLDAKSAKAVESALAPDSVTGNAKEGLEATWELGVDLIKSSKEGGICSFGPEIGGGFRANVRSTMVELENCDEGMLQTMARLTARSARHLAALGIVFAIEPEEGVAQIMCDTEVKGMEAGVDLALIQTTISVLLAARAFKSLNYTDHPLSYFDFAQAIGMVQGVKEGMTNAMVMQATLDPVLKAEKKKKAKAGKGAGKGKAKPGKKPEVIEGGKGKGKKKPEPVPDPDTEDPDANDEEGADPQE